MTVQLAVGNVLADRVLEQGQLITKKLLKEVAEEQGVRPQDVVDALKGKDNFRLKQAHITSPGHLIEATRLPETKEELLRVMGIRKGMNRQAVEDAFNAFMRERCIVKLGVFPYRFRRYSYQQERNATPGFKADTIRVLDDLMHNKAIRENDKPAADQAIAFLNKNTCFGRDSAIVSEGKIDPLSSKYIDDLHDDAFASTSYYVSNRIARAYQDALLEVMRVVRPNYPLRNPQSILSNLKDSVLTAVLPAATPK